MNTLGLPIPKFISGLSLALVYIAIADALHIWGRPWTTPSHQDTDQWSAPLT